jgi:hypothetical protein
MCVYFEGFPMANALVLSRSGKKIADPAVVAFASTRRGGHGAADWSLPMHAARLRQPQDGAPETKSKMMAFRARPQTGVFQEPEDAALTGDTRSLNRRLLGLNVGAKRRIPAMVCGPVVKTRVA